jgi:hypothetical protein
LGTFTVGALGALIVGIWVPVEPPPLLEPDPVEPLLSSELMSLEFPLEPPVPLSGEAGPLVPACLLAKPTTPLVSLVGPV